MVEQTPSVTSMFLSLGSHPWEEQIAFNNLPSTIYLQQIVLSLLKEEWICFSNSRLETLPLSHESSGRKQLPVFVWK